MDSAKDSAREMLAAINVEGSGFWLLFLFLSQQNQNSSLPVKYEFDVANVMKSFLNPNK